MTRVDRGLAERLHRRAGADRWQVSVAEFAAALERSAAKLGALDGRQLARALEALHLEDLALASACEAGRDAAWDHFVIEYRPSLYRAAGIIAGDEGRELADSLYGELYGLRERGGERQSLFRYFHGRSSLGTWLRAILAQRHVDTLRGRRRFDPLPEDDGPAALPAPTAAADAETRRLGQLVRDAFTAAMTSLLPRDRLRLGWYYAQGMTLAEIGRLCREHEATVSRHLNRTRKALRADVEARLADAGLGQREIAEAFAAAAGDPGDIDLARLVDVPRKISVDPRSRVEER
jgi:RNA polymerase sigma-70 factor (ECF subfamily)